jgi:hypothetical protein
VSRISRSSAVGTAVACAGLAIGGCAPEASPVTARPGEVRTTAAARYLAIAEAGNHRLEHDFDALERQDRFRLNRAKADLADAAATERLFDHRLLGIAFPPETQRFAVLLYQFNQYRAGLTADAAASITSLSQLRSWQRRLDAANSPVEEVVRVIRSQLGLAPPQTS